MCDPANAWGVAGCLTLSLSVSVSLYLCLTFFLTLGVGGQYGLGFKGCIGVCRCWTRKGMPGREDERKPAAVPVGPFTWGPNREGTSRKCVLGRVLLVVMGQRKGDKPVVATLPHATLSPSPVP